MNLRLKITVSQNAIPAFIVIRNFSGEILYFNKIYRRETCLCLRTCEKNLIITVTPFNQRYREISKFLKFGNIACYCLRLNYEFEEQVPETLQNFTLTDANYGFKIASAILSFLLI